MTEEKTKDSGLSVEEILVSVVVSHHLEINKLKSFCGYSLIFNLLFAAYIVGALIL